MDKDKTPNKRIIQEKDSALIFKSTGMVEVIPALDECGVIDSSYNNYLATAFFKMIENQSPELSRLIAMAMSTLTDQSAESPKPSHEGVVYVDGSERRDH